MKNKFNEILRDLRNDARLTQAQLAQKLGFTQRKISYLESGKIEPDLAALIALSKFFNVSADYLIGIEN